MRYAVLLLLGSFGVLLLLIAGYRYRVVSAQIAILNSVDGIVESVGADGQLNLKYSVGSETYEIVRSSPLRFPKLRAHDRVALLYPSARPDTARLRDWSVQYPDSAVAGSFGIVAILLAVGAFAAMGNVPSRIATQEQKEWPVAAQLDTPIELRNERNEFYISLAMSAVAFAAAFGLFRSPEFLWTRWITYPAMALTTLLGVGLIFAAFQNQTLRIRANPDGMEVSDSSGSRRFAWKDVAALKRETVTRSTWNSGKYFKRGYSDNVIGGYFILLDGAGKELLKLDGDVPMKPFADWMRLRPYILARTSLPVKEETRETLL